MKPPIRHGGAPASGTDQARSTTAVSSEEMWRQMCFMQSDIRDLLGQARETTEIMRSMLTEQQLMRGAIQASMAKIEESVAQMSGVSEKTADLIVKTEAFMTTNSAAMEKLDDAIESNADSVEQIVDSVKQMVVDNEANMEMFGDVVEQITVAALTLANVVSAGDSEKVKQAEASARARVEKDKPKRKADREAARSAHRTEAEKKWTVRAERRNKIVKGHP